MSIDKKATIARTSGLIKETDEATTTWVHRQLQAGMVYPPGAETIDLHLREGMTTSTATKALQRSSTWQHSTT